METVLETATATVEVRGEKIPALGFGTWMLEGEDCVLAVRHALDLGYRHIDTAQAYGNEEEVGRGLAESSVPRDEVFLTTKVWFENLGFDELVRSVRASLERLGTDYVDLLLIHWPSEAVPFDEPLRALQKLRDDGATRHVGVSNFPPTLLRRALEQAPIVCNQVEYHPFLAQEELLEIAREEGLMLTAYCPLARRRVLRDPTLRAIGERHGKAPSQVALRWLIQQERVAAIPKASSPEHRRQNFDLFDFELTDDEMERISALARGQRLIDPEFGPDWER